MLYLKFKDLDLLFAFDDGAEPVADELTAVLVGWPCERTTDKPDGIVYTLTRRVGEEFELFDVINAQRVIEPSVTSAVSTIIVELVNEYVARSAGLGSLHSAAVEIGSRLIVFPAGTRAGKSTLSTAFTAAGYRVFSDDLLPIDFSTGEAVATGCLPRIRLPMPRGAPAWFRDHVMESTVATDGYYVYTGATAQGRVVFGDRSPLGAIVLLERSETPVEARLEPARLDEALTRVLGQDTRANLAADSAFDRYLELVSGLEILRFTYCDLDDAIACIADAFASWPERRRQALQAGPDLSTDQPAPLLTTGNGQRFRRSDDVWLRTVDDTGFLVDPVANQIHHVNQMGIGLWNLLAQPVDLQSAVTVFAQAFPDVGHDDLIRDLGTLLAEFEALGLIVTVASDGGGTAIRPVAAPDDLPAFPG
jgi:hypothetical protein